MKIVLKYAIMLLVILAMVFQTGCSITGWATKEPPNGLNLDEGNIVIILQKDGKLFTGEFVGIERIPIANYIDEYTRKTNDAIGGAYLPIIGQKVHLTTTLSEVKIWQGQFLGFDHKNIWLILDGKSDPEPVYFSSITSLSGRKGDSFRRMELRNLFLDGKIPLMSAIKIKGENQTIEVPVSDIQGLVMVTGHDNADAGGIMISGDQIRDMMLR